MAVEVFTKLHDFVSNTAPICYGILKPGLHVEKGVPVVKVKNIQSGQINTSDLLRTTQEIDDQYKRSRIQPGDLLLTIRGSTGRVAIVPAELTSANITQDTARIRVSSDDSTEYLFYALQSERVQQQIFLNTVGQAVKGINISEVKKLSLLHPPLPEQQKIAKILQTWDRAIATTEKLIDASKQQKKALMQQLLTGKKRFAGFEGEWELTALGDVFGERRETEHTELQLLSITSGEGVINRSEVGRKDTSNLDKTKYKRICAGDIGYNTMRMWQGVSGVSPVEGIVSPAYTVITPTPSIDATYASYLFKLPLVVSLFERNSQGLVSDTWNLKFKHFSKIQMALPSIEEQVKIASALGTVDQQIKAAKERAEHLSSEKKSLMQQLLTGKRRVKVDEAA